MAAAFSTRLGELDSGVGVSKKILLQLLHLDLLSGGGRSVSLMAGGPLADARR